MQCLAGPTPPGISLSRSEPNTPMPDTRPEDDDTVPNAKSPGNEGARGSRGQANSGAQPGNPDSQDNERAPSAGTPDLRDADAQGGGGAASDSSRSK